MQLTRWVLMSDRTIIFTTGHTEIEVVLGWSTGVWRVSVHRIEHLLLHLRYGVAVKHLHLVVLHERILIDDLQRLQGRKQKLP